MTPSRPFRVLLRVTDRSKLPAIHYMVDPLSHAHLTMKWTGEWNGVSKRLRWYLGYPQVRP
jgi:hypothetical protein